MTKDDRINLWSNNAYRLHGLCRAAVYFHVGRKHERRNGMKWEAEEKGYTCNDCGLAMSNCHDKSICCEDETGLCDYFEEMGEKKE